VLLVTEDDRGLILILAGRLLWRYRSELAPLAVALGLAVCGVWAHAVHPGWAVAIAAVATIGAAVILWPRIATLARCWSVLGRRAERIYAASVVLLGGLWLAAATRWGPGAGALPTVALVGTVAGGVPWWAHRRRHARVRVERTIEAGEWERRIDLIRREKAKILDQLQIFPTLERLIQARRG